VHGIRDEDVRDSPQFRQIARSLLEFLEDADLAGYNVRRFDAPILDREFRDCGMDLGLSRRRVIDAMTIFHRKEPRDLSAAVRLFLGRPHEGAHSAEADVAAAAEVLDAQLERYPDLPRTVEALDTWCGASRKAGP
jgi:DNA polymerase-3 subunit epsilon